VSLQQISGNAGQWYVNGSLLGSANTAYTLSNSKANINSANLQYLPSIDNEGNVTISYKQYKINSVFGNIAQANVSAVYSIGNTNSEISNMIARTITANAVANIFATSTPAISDGSDVGQSYTITLSSPVGRFGNSAANALAANSYSYTGNITQVNNEFTNMKFVNDYGIGAIIILLMLFDNHAPHQLKVLFAIIKCLQFDISHKSAYAIESSVL
jgi:hypothetical protein